MVRANPQPVLHEKPRFDLSFLPAPVSYWQKVDEQVRQFFSEIVITIRETVAQFAQMPAPLTPTAVMNGATRSQGLHTPAQLLELPKGESGLHIALQVLPPAEEGATLVVLVKDAPDGTPLEHVRVHLYDHERRLLFGLTTDVTGTAHFRELGIGRYRLQVRHGQIKEEIPVLIITPT
ncbi:MAG: carboxypeptidase-like regulatory domain-containing protein [Caldilineaceae bacterium]